MAKDRSRERRPAAPTRSWTVRVRVLTTVVAFMTVGLALTGVLTYAAQFRALDQRITDELWQEYDELALIAANRDDSGALVHTTVDSVLVHATDSAAPSDHESVITFLEGKPRYEPRSQGFALLPQPPQPPEDATPEETARIAEEAAQIAEESERVRQQLLDAHRPGQTVIISMEAYGKDLRVLIASVAVEGDDSQGIFVVANDIGAQRRSLWQSVLTFSGLAVVTLLLASWVGYAVIGRLLRPLEDLRSATEQITVDDLEYRVPVPEQRDDIGALAQNFNRMLGRIQAGFAEQRRFMSDVGHELRTPLTIVRGTLETTDIEDVEDVRESREIALEELERMGRVVGDLSELAASKRPDYVRSRPLDLEGFAHSAFARIEHIAEREWILERTVEVVADADEQRLAQAVVQLAANAVRYSSEGSRIRFGVDRVLGAGGPEIHVTMQDEGVGIDKEDQRRIFERFTRVHGSSSAGSGLGLPIVLAIAEGHGGVVRLLSAPGRGSTFTIVFPQFTDKAAIDADAPGGPDGQAIAPARDTGGRGTAPAEDDDTTARRRNDG